MSWDDLNESHYDWPTVAAVRAYRNAVNETVNQLINWESPLWPVVMGIEHDEEPLAANWNLEHGASSVPVDTFKHGDFYDLVGNGCHRR